MSEHPRLVASDIVSGRFRLPLGLRLFQREAQDPLGIVDPETGYETMVFFEGCSFFSLHTRHYETLDEAKEGHKHVMSAIRAKTLPMAIVIDNYWISETAEVA